MTYARFCAAFAQGIQGQLHFPHHPPGLAGVQPVNRIILPFMIVLSLFLDPVPFASAVTGIDKRRTSRITAWMILREWNHSHPQM
jgi:hypothetical protein